jgi:curli biogenesis system outer membrane secretion channel CsgG
MIASFLLLLLSSIPLQTATPPPSRQNQSAASNSGAKVAHEIAAKLLNVRRIYVESFGGDSASQQLQAMVINSLAESKRFIVTENKDKADAVLKGTGLEKRAQEFHAIAEGTAVSTAAGGGHGEVSGNVSNGTGSISGSSSGGFSSKSLAASDSQASTETVDDAHLAVRLVSTDGDVIWTTTKESKGAKYKGASADVADQIVKQLLWDLDKLGAPKAN